MEFLIMFAEGLTYSLFVPIVCTENGVGEGRVEMI